MSKSRNLLIALLAACAYAIAFADSAKYFGIGREASPAEIAGWDIDVRPDGQGLPPGKGSARNGEQVYMGKCAACHGEFGESAGRWPQVAGGSGSPTPDAPGETGGSSLTAP